MFEVREKPEMVERALLIRICSNRREADEAESLLEELGELVSTLGIEVVESVLVFTRALHKKFLCGTGKAQEMVDLAHAHECDVMIFDNMFLPSQQRNWEELADMCVIDREEVILDIFSKRAHTREARLQVDLARMQYSLPRLARMWGHLDREGGSGGSGGIVTPIFYIGATSGQLFGTLVGGEHQLALFAALGFVSVLAGATNAPIAALIMSMELFGMDVAHYAAVSISISFLILGHRSVFPSQKLAMKKSDMLDVKYGEDIEHSHISLNRHNMRQFGKIRRKMRSEKFKNSRIYKFRQRKGSKNSSQKG